MFGEIDLLFENRVPARKFKSTKVDRKLKAIPCAPEKQLTDILGQSSPMALSSKPKPQRLARLCRRIWTKARKAPSFLGLRGRLFSQHLIAGSYDKLRRGGIVQTRQIAIYESPHK